MSEQEQREWEAHEAGWREGYEDGVMDFVEVERRKALLRAKGIPVIGDRPTLGQRIKRFFKGLKWKLINRKVGRML